MKNLKSKIILIILAASLIGLLGGGCGINGDKKTDRHFKYRIIEVDSCEYIIFWDNIPNMAVTHKADCKNVIHKHCKNNGS